MGQHWKIQASPWNRYVPTGELEKPQHGNLLEIFENLRPRTAAEMRALDKRKEELSLPLSVAIYMIELNEAIEELKRIPGKAALRCRQRLEKLRGIPPQQKEHSEQV